MNAVTTNTVNVAGEFEYTDILNRSRANWNSGSSKRIIFIIIVLILSILISDSPQPRPQSLPYLQQKQHVLK